MSQYISHKSRHKKILPQQRRLNPEVMMILVSNFRLMFTSVGADRNPPSGLNGRRTQLRRLQNVLLLSSSLLEDTLNTLQ